MVLKSIVFICPYPVGESPSQRFRFEQYFDTLHATGVVTEVHSFMAFSLWQILYQPGNTGRKMLGVIRGFIDRILLLSSVRHFDYVFIHREATPIGPPWFEWTVAKILRKKIVYDLDDAIWLPNTSHENKLVSKLKCHSKVKSICKWSHAVSCGNEHLCDFAKQFNDNVFLNPTTIDAEKLHNPARYPKKIKSDKIVIGWTGTHSTLKYIDPILPAIQSLEKRFPDKLQFIVIADKKPSFVLSSLSFIKWSKETEIQDLLRFDIGLMPLTDDMWAQGKCGFKALQYMALGIPVLASTVGVNSIIISDGTDGFLCGSLSQWEENLQKLMRDVELRKQMGAKGREKIVKYYSVNSNSSNFLSLFE